MKLSLIQVIELNRMAAKRCPIHVHRNPGCSICARLSEEIKAPLSDNPESYGSEAELQDAIAAECRRRGWPFINPRRDRETTIQAGAPDFVIAASNGRTLWIECKSAIGKQSTEQIGFQMMLNHHGHVYHLCRSFIGFIAIVDGTTQVTPHPRHD